MPYSIKNFRSGIVLYRPRSSINKLIVAPFNPVGDQYLHGNLLFRLQEMITQSRYILVIDLKLALMQKFLSRCMALMPPAEKFNFMMKIMVMNLRKESRSI